MSAKLSLTFVVLTLAFAGCRCDDGSRAKVDAGAQPTMPTGMLAPATSSSAAPSARGPKLLAVTRVRTTETVVIEIDGAPRETSASFTYADAIALLHEPLAQTMPGFNLMIPRPFPPQTFSLLQAQLGAFRQAWTGTTTAHDAKERWAKVSSVIADLANDAEWLEAQASLVSTIDAILETVKVAEAQGKALWIRTVS